MNLMAKVAAAITVLGVVVLGVGWIGNARSADSKGANIGAEVLQLGGTGLLIVGVILLVVGIVTNRRSME